MIPIIATVRCRDKSDIPPYSVDGFAPTPDCSLAIVPAISYDLAKEAWCEIESVHRRPWKVLHQVTGFYLGPDWYSQEDAWRLMLACEPDFAAWQYATGDVEEAATIACKHHFERAKELTGVRAKNRSRSKP
jgi:hypothetical protein